MTTTLIIKISYQHHAVIIIPDGMNSFCQVRAGSNILGQGFLQVLPQGIRCGCTLEGVLFLLDRGLGCFFVFILFFLKFL